MDLSANLSLPYIAPQQSQKHVTVNDALRRLDAVTQLTVISRVITAQPELPADGACYILPSGKTGPAWSAMANFALAYYVDGAWVQISPKAGWRAYVIAESRLVVYSGSIWSEVSGSGAGSGATAAGPVFDYQTNANQSLGASGAWQKLTNFAAPRIAHADFSATNSRYTASSAGAHLFLGQIVQTPGGVTSSFGAFAKNGSPTGNWIIKPVTTGVQDFMLVSSLLDLAVGDYVDFMIFTQAATTISSGYTSFGGYRL